jgi:hypothetical protein
MTNKNLPPSHGLTGKAGNKVDDSMALLLSDYFNEILQLATPRATLVIRTVVREQVERTELCDNDEEIVELPLHMSKRSLYDRCQRDHCTIACCLNLAGSTPTM